jgi:acyl carrier protein
LLLARTALPPRTQWRSPKNEVDAQRIRLVRELEGGGASIDVRGCDLADTDSLRAVLARHDEEGWPALRGVFHLAGKAADALSWDLTGEHWQTTFASKAVAAAVIAEATAHHPLDAFVLFSSASSRLGQPGQGAYAAANGSLDAIAVRIRASGVNAISIGWGAWEGLGLATGEGGLRLVAHLARQGLRPLPLPDALGHLAHLASASTAHALVLKADWDVVCAQAPASKQKLLHTLAAPRADGEERARILAKVEPQEQRAQLSAHLCQVVASVLGTQPERVDAKIPFGALGLDSLMALEVRRRLERSLGLQLSTTLVFAHPTLEKLGDHLYAQLIPTEASVAPALAAHEEELLSALLQSEAEKP